MSPKPSHSQYNRFKYYSALNTGFDHFVTKKNVDIDYEFLTPPEHIIEPNLFLIQNPFGEGKFRHSLTLLVE